MDEMIVFVCKAIVLCGDWTDGRSVGSSAAEQGQGQSIGNACFAGLSIGHDRLGDRGMFDQRVDWSIE